MQKPLGYALSFGLVIGLWITPSFAYASKQFQVDTAGTLTTGLVSYYPLEGNSNDFYGTNNGTDTGSPTYSSGNGKVNQGVGSFTAGGKINLGSASNLNITSDFTIAGWINFSDITVGATTIYVQEDVGTYNNMIILRKMAGSGHIGMFVIHSGTEYDCDTSGTTAPLTNNTWYHIAYTFQNSTCGVLKVNNSTVTLTKTFGTYTTLPDRTGENAILFGENYASFVSAKADEWGIWNTTLSDTNIGDLYNSGSGQTMIDASTTTATSTMQDVTNSYLYIMLIVAVFLGAGYIGYKIIS